MTGPVQAARKRREGAAGVSSREAALECHPRAGPLNRAPVSAGRVQ